MRATSGALPRGADWRYELKWDGMRAIVHLGSDGLTAWSGNGRDITAGFPELALLENEIGFEAVLDGELVAMEPETGRPSFSRLQARMHRRANQTDVAANPVVLVVFDLLRFDGHDIRRLSFDKRRATLDDVLGDGTVWLTTEVSLDGDTLLASARSQNFEGVVAKLGTSTYQSDRRSRSWIKVKLTRRQEFVAVGYTPGSGEREATLGSLVLATRFGDALECCGRVGTGFDDALLQSVDARLAARSDRDLPLRSDTEPEAIWLANPFVVEVDFAELTPDRRLRHAVFVGIREDKDPADVRFDHTEPE